MGRGGTCFRLAGAFYPQRPPPNEASAIFRERARAPLARLVRLRRDLLDPHLVADLLCHIERLLLVLGG